MTRPHRLLFFDIETSPLLAHVWRAHDNYVAPERLKHDTFLFTWAAKWSDRNKVEFGRLTSAEARAKDDSRIVAKLAGLIRQADKTVAHNGDRFDTPIVQGRLLQHGMEPLGPVGTIDTLKIARRSFKIASNKLDYLAQLLGEGAKLPTDFALWEDAYQGKDRALRELDTYCREDVRLLERVYHRIAPYGVGLPRLVDGGGCSKCGGWNLTSRGFYHTSASTFRRFRCNDCGRWNRAVSRESEGAGTRPL